MNRKYSEDVRLEILNFYREGMKPREIAERLAVHLRMVYRTIEAAGARQDSQKQVRRMSDSRVSALISTRVYINPNGDTPGAPWGTWDWKRVGRPSQFETAATKKQPWDMIEWEGVLCQTDDTPIQALIKIQDRDRIDRARKERAIKRGEGKELLLDGIGEMGSPNLEIDPANDQSEWGEYRRAIVGWARFSDDCAVRRAINDIEPDRIYFRANQMSKTLLYVREMRIYQDDIAALFANTPLLYKLA